MTLVVPPDAVMASPEVDMQAFPAEHLQHMPGLAELFEPDGMHTTPTVDYAFVLEGEVWLETDGGKLTRLQAGDILVQNGTRHGWRNQSDKAAVIAAILIGTASDGES
ncbi:cupin domain-containing protein [Nocardia vinacea]|uniref:cupin domain-containing protein n=1 Tax=Nocardia vinacea TaxID=96468 RepID=UPI0034334EA1